MNSHIIYRGYTIDQDAERFVIKFDGVICTVVLSEEAAYKWIDAAKRKSNGN